MYHYEYIETVLSQGIFLCSFFILVHNFRGKWLSQGSNFGLALEDESDCKEDG